MQHMLSHLDKMPNILNGLSSFFNFCCLRFANQTLNLKTSHINQFFCLCYVRLLSPVEFARIFVIRQVFKKVLYFNIYIPIQPLIDSLFKGTIFELRLIYQDLLLAVYEINDYVSIR